MTLPLLVYCTNSWFQRFCSCQYRSRWHFYRLQHHRPDCVLRHGCFGRDALVCPDGSYVHVQLPNCQHCPPHLNKQLANFSLGGFGGYATRFVDPALGFATGYAYLFKYLLATPNQMAATALIMEASSNTTGEYGFLSGRIKRGLQLMGYHFSFGLPVGSTQPSGSASFWSSSLRSTCAV